MRIDLEKLKGDIQKYFDKSGGHTFDHTERVYNLAVQIAEEGKADLEVVKLAALLHDIARKKEEEGIVECHAEEGVKMAGDILKDLNIPEDKIKKIVHCIEVHRFKKQLKPETKEAKILQDADRLDILGAIAIGRIFAISGMRGYPIYDPKIKPKKVYDSSSQSAINHFYEKILKIKPETFHTGFARKKARERYEFVKEFLRRFLDEWEGKD